MNNELVDRGSVVADIIKRFSNSNSNCSSTEEVIENKTRADITAAVQRLKADYSTFRKPSLERQNSPSTHPSISKPAPSPTFKPEPPSAEKPKPPSAEKPKPPSAEKPKPPSAEKPKPPSAEKPKPPSAEKPKPPSAEKPKPPSAKKPKPPSAESSDVDEKPILSLQIDLDSSSAQTPPTSPKKVTFSGTPELKASNESPKEHQLVRRVTIGTELPRSSSLGPRRATCGDSPRPPKPPRPSADVIRRNFILEPNGTGSPSLQPAVIKSFLEECSDDDLSDSDLCPRSPSELSELPSPVVKPSPKHNTTEKLLLPKSPKSYPSHKPPPPTSPKPRSVIPVSPGKTISSVNAPDLPRTQSVPLPKSPPSNNPEMARSESVAIPRGKNSPSKAEQDQKTMELYKLEQKKWSYLLRNGINCVIVGKRKGVFKTSTKVKKAFVFCLTELSKIYLTTCSRHDPTVAYASTVRGQVNKLCDPNTCKKTKVYFSRELIDVVHAGFSLMTGKELRPDLALPGPHDNDRFALIFKSGQSVVLAVPSQSVPNHIQYISDAVQAFAWLKRATEQQYC